MNSEVCIFVGILQNIKFCLKFKDCLKCPKLLMECLTFIEIHRLLWPLSLADYERDQHLHQKLIPTRGSWCTLINKLFGVNKPSQ